MTSLDSAMPLLLHLLQHYHNPAVAVAPKSGKAVKKTVTPKRVKKVVEEKVVVQNPKKTKKVPEETLKAKITPKQTLKLRLPKSGKSHKVAAKKVKEPESENAVELPIEFEEFFAE